MNSSVLCVSTRRISRTPSAAIERYLRQLDSLTREDYEQAISDWPVIQFMQVNLARHLTDGILFMGTPALDHLLNGAIRGYVGVLRQCRRTRLQAWIAGACATWEQIPPFTVQCGDAIWECGANQNFDEFLAGCESADLRIITPSAVTGWLQGFLLCPWPKIAADLKLSV